MFGPISRVGFKVTDYCNLQCKYCFQHKNLKEQTIGFTDYDALFNFLLNNNTTESFHITFAGGEPTTAEDNIYIAYRKLKRLERRKNIRIRFSITTNGTNLNVIRRLVENSIVSPELVTMSYDGIHSTSSRNPKEYSCFTDEYFNNVLLEIANDPILKNILISIALTPNNINNFMDTIQYLYDIGILNWEYYFISDYSCNYDLKFADKFRSALEYSMSKFNLDMFRMFNLINYHYKKHIQELMDVNMHHRLPYCTKLTDSIFVDINGDIYPCIYFSQDSRYINSNETFKIGSIYSGIDQNCYDRFYQTVLSPIDNVCIDDLDFPCCSTFICPAIMYYKQNSYNHSPYYILQNIEEKIFDKIDDTIKISIQSMTLKDDYTIQSYLYKN